MMTSFEKIRLHSGILDVTGNFLYLNSIKVGANPLAQGNVPLTPGSEEYRINFAGTYTDAPATVIGDLLVESGNPLYSYDIYNIDKSGFNVAFSDIISENCSFLYHVLPSGTQNDFVGTGSQGGGGITGAYVRTFNGQTGDVTFAASGGGITGDYVATFNGATGNVVVEIPSSAPGNIYMANNYF